MSRRDINSIVLNSTNLLSNETEQKLKAFGKKVIDSLPLVNNIVAKKRMKQLREFPVHLGIMGTNFCNARCVFCIHRLQTDKHLFLDMDVFKKVVTEFAARGFEFRVGITPTYGDPLTDPQFLERMKFLNKFKKINYKQITTNLIAAKSVGIVPLLRSGLDIINISIGGLDKSSYERLYQVNAYDHVFATLLELIETNHKLKYPVEIDIAVRCDEELSVVEKKPDYLKLRKLQKTRRFSLNLANEYDDWGEQVDLAAYNLKAAKASHPQKRIACGNLYSGPALGADNKFYLCQCKDTRNTELVYGDAKINTVTDLVKYRQNLIDAWEKKGKIPKTCKDCKAYNNPHITFGLAGDRSTIISLASRTNK